ncbi:hypothetical protein ABH547_01620 [Escherichia coli]|uniref:hypothetical protein n=1 Tax=Escherichia coli TaxID=562 RepID=UPI003264F0CE
MRVVQLAAASFLITAPGHLAMWCSGAPDDATSNGFSDSPVVATGDQIVRCWNWT